MLNKTWFFSDKEYMLRIAILYYKSKRTNHFFSIVLYDLFSTVKKYYANLQRKLIK